MNLRLRTDDLDWRAVDEEIVVLDSCEGEYLTLNTSGSLLWRMLAKRSTKAELVAALMDAYEVDEPTAAADAGAFLGALSDRGLLAA